MTERSFKISSMFMFFVSRYFHMGARLLLTERSFTKARSVRALHRKRMNEEFIQLFIAFYPVILKKVAFYGKKLNTIEKHS